MSFKAQIEEFPFTKALVISSECKMMAMPKTMSRSFGEIMSFFKSKDMPLTGTPFTRYNNFKWLDVSNQGFLRMLIEMFTRKWTFQCGLPIESVVDGQDNIEYAEYSPGKVITCMHIGPYHKIGKTYKELYKWSQQKGLDLVDVSYELYLNDPREVPTNDLQTKVIVPFR